MASNGPTADDGGGAGDQKDDSQKCEEVVVESVSEDAANVDVTESPKCEKEKTTSYMSSVKKMVTPKCQKKSAPPKSPIEYIELSDDDEQNESSSRSQTVSPGLVYSSTARNMDVEAPSARRSFQIIEMNPTPQVCQPSTIFTARASNQQYIQNPSFYGAQSSGPEKKQGYHDLSSSTSIVSYSGGSVLLPDDNPNSFLTFGGNDKLLEQLRMLVRPALIPEISGKLGFTPPRGFLLHGPPGTGKTFLATCIAGELQMNFVRISATELVSGISGNTEENIRSLFTNTVNYAPAVLLIDEIDAIAGARDAASKKMEQRAVSQLLVSFDMLNEEVKKLTYLANVLIIGATNRLEAIDPSLRRAGRFDQEICLGMPTRDSRIHMLKVMTSSVTLSDDVDINWLADVTPGFVAADLKALIVHSAINRVNRLFLNSKKIEEFPPRLDECSYQSLASEISAAEKGTESCDNPSNVNISNEKRPLSTPSDNSPQRSKKRRLNAAFQTKDGVDENLYPSPPISNDFIVDPCDKTRALKVHDLDDFAIEKEDLEAALKQIQPSAKREGFATVPNVKWTDVGSLQGAKHQLQLSILIPLKYRALCKNLGITSTSGLLLCGPPGCGKTLLAKAVANEANINFISVKGPELLNMYVGESERAVRQCFQRARNSEPCVIFFDEIDSLCPKRSPSSDGHTGSRLVNQLLTEMDGVEGGRSGVFLMAATNRPDILDPAILRPGRFDKTIYIGLPNASERVEILSAITKNGAVPTLDADVNLHQIGVNQCENFSGADLHGLVKEASVCALTEYISDREKSADADPVVDEDVNIVVKNEHFTKALLKIKPSVSPEEILKYEEFRKYSSLEPQVP